LKLAHIQWTEIKNFEKLNPKSANVFQCWEEQVNITPGESTTDAGIKSLLALNQGINDLMENNIQALVTGPVNKSNIAETQANFKGQTELIAEKVGSESSMMFLVSPSIKIGLMSNHLSIKEVPQALDISAIIQKTEMMIKSLKEDFMIVKPKIAILGLNPHSGDNGLIGKEEKEIIAPAVDKLKGKGHICLGPFAADGFFGAGLYRQFDGVLAMYHDQGLIPFKTIAFEDGVNFTAGINVVRTSPDHGTAYDIAGKGDASPDSMRAAIFEAIAIYNNRQVYKEMTANPIERLKLSEDNDA
jgi:4-hydroxythreonine-4-phosphate dehydrogenase